MSEIIIPILVLGLTGFAFSLLLALLSKKLKVEESPGVTKVLELLPGLNCGACGFSGCRAFAEAVTKECNVFSGCLPAGAEVNKQIAETVGVTGCISSHTQVVICHCSAKKKEKKAKKYSVLPLLPEPKKFLSSSPITEFILTCKEENKILKVDTIEGGIISDIDLQSYLNCEYEGLIARKFEDIILRESKIGIARKNTSHSTDEGKIYRVGMRRLKNLKIVEKESYYRQEYCGCIYSMKNEK